MASDQGTNSNIDEGRENDMPADQGAPVNRQGLQDDVNAGAAEREDEDPLNAVADSVTRESDGEDDFDEWEEGDAYRRRRRKRTPQGDVYSAARSGQSTNAVPFTLR